MTGGTAGRVRRVNGPLLEADGLAGVAMADLVEVGAARLPAEVVSLDGERATLQAYEYTGGIAPGACVHALGRPLAARLGPGLLGGVFDGMLRPLAGAGTWLGPGLRATDSGRRWTFSPAGQAGRMVGPGHVLGTVDRAGREGGWGSDRAGREGGWGSDRAGREGGWESDGEVPIPHRVLVPPELRGRLSWLAPAGRYRADEPVAAVDGVEVTMATWWPVRRPRPFLARQPCAAPLLTGQRVLDAIFPVAKGGCAAVPGGFGTGKTVLLQQIAKWCDADVIVYVGCGERGNEMADVVAELAALTDPRTGGRLAERTVVIANTSNMPVMAREASIHTGVTVAEYFRDMGHDAVVIADSTSRWAEALREFASRSGALPAEEGYPAGLASALAAFYERAGRVTTLGGAEGSVTVIGAVSPPGGDLTEPVTAHTQRFVRSLWTLDRDLAYARHYPAVAWADSYCRDAAVIGTWYTGQGDPGWAARRARAAALLAEADRLAALAELVGLAALPGHDRVVLLAGRLLREGVLQQSSLSATDAYCAPAKSAALLDLVLDVVDRCDQMVAAGVAPAVVEEVDFSPVLRAREETGPSDADGVRQYGKLMAARLEELS